MNNRYRDLARRWAGRLGCVLALAFPPASLAAHPLPDSTVEVTVSDTEITLLLALPLGELALALPALKNLGDLPPDGPLSVADTDAVARYLAAHLALSPPLHFIVQHAQILSAQDDHVGGYKQVVVDLSAPLTPAQTVFPLTLSYDAILHEVRSHRADVSLKTGANPAVPVGQIRFDLTNGQATPLVLTDLP